MKSQFRNNTFLFEENGKTCKVIEQGKGILCMSGSKSKFFTKKFNEISTKEMVELVREFINE